MIIAFAKKISVVVFAPVLSFRFLLNRRRTGHIPKEIFELTKSVKSKLNTGQHAPTSRPSSAMSVSKFIAFNFPLLRTVQPGKYMVIPK